MDAHLPQQQATREIVCHWNDGVKTTVPRHGLCPTDEQKRAACLSVRLQQENLHAVQLVQSECREKK